MPTTGRDYDTVLAAYTGADLSSLTKIACNDDISLGEPQSAISFPTLAGETYYFQVGGYLGGFGSLHFQLRPNGPRADE